MNTREEKRARATRNAIFDPYAPDRNHPVLQDILDKRIDAERDAPATAGPNSWDAFVDLDKAQQKDFDAFCDENPIP